MNNFPMFSVNSFIRFQSATIQAVTKGHLFEHFAKVAALGCPQTRQLGKTTLKRRTTHAPRWWVQRKTKFSEEYLSKENKDYIQEVIKTTCLEAGQSPLKEPLFKRGTWTPESRRTGVIARKIGSYPLWTEGGKRVLATLLQIVDNHVIRYIPPEKVKESYLGYRYTDLAFLVVGAESADPQLFTAEYNGLFTEAGVMTKRKLTRFLITPNAALAPGTPLTATHFRAGDFVNVYGKTVGRGFQGVVKRWGFAGGPAAHGNTKSHRRPGNIGAGAGRKDNIWKGTKMPGHMGQERRTLAGLQILRINYKYNVLWVKGDAVPGSTHSYVYIMDCKLHKKKHTDDNPPPFPTYYPDETDPLPDEVWANNMHNFSSETITFEEGESQVAAAKKK